MCLNDLHSGVLSKGPEERAHGDHDYHLRGRDRGKPTPQATTRAGGGIPGGRGGRQGPAALHHMYVCICIYIYIYI